jgi:hypothetical protein
MALIDAHRSVKLKFLRQLEGFVSVVSMNAPPVRQDAKEKKWRISKEQTIPPIWFILAPFVEWRFC